ncbi:MAG: protein BatD [Bacteroidales bacterium]|nr:protein BatD [Candidatus Colicola coprequi]
MKLRQYIFTLALCITHCVFCMADDEVDFRANAPKQVVVGSPFQLTYTINTQARDFRAPEFVDFDHLAGPYTSQSSSTSFVNGHRTSSFTLTYTFTLVGMKEGTFTIGPATIKANGSQHTSNGVRITVLPPDEPVASSQSQQQQRPSSRPQQSYENPDNNVSRENIFIRTVVNKTRVHEQEAILLSYKLYFAGVDVAQFTNNTKLPEFAGFLKQELDQEEIQTELEHYNGRNYQTATLYRTLLYPQHSGDIKIDPAQFEAVLRVQTRAQVRSIFDDFFGSYANVQKMLTAPGVTIHVEELPTGKPSDYNGGVGTFSLNSSISSQEVKTNEAITIRLEIKGSGNMKLLKTPAVDWPEGFEAYDPKVTNKFKTSTSGVSGTKTIEYLAIPRAAGQYAIPPVTLSYFDIQEGKYVRLSSPEYTLNILRGTEDADASTVVQQFNQPTKEDITQFGTDIRYISVVPWQMPVVTKQMVAFGTPLFYMLYVIPLLIAIVLFIVFRKQIRENADINRVRYKKANKIAQKRLKTAKAYLTTGAKEHFYEEIERAARSYLSDRLSIAMADMSKDNIAEILRKKNIDNELISEVDKVLSTAEFARYAPSSDTQMQQIFEQTANLIDKLENQKL